MHARARARITQRTYHTKLSHSSAKHKAKRVQQDTHAQAQARVQLAPYVLTTCQLKPVPNSARLQRRWQQRGANMQIIGDDKQDLVIRQMAAHIYQGYEKDMRALVPVCLNIRARHSQL